MPQLIVLNVSFNNIGCVTIDWHMDSLAALVLNNNHIRLIQGLQLCRALDTLVLSHNELTELKLPPLRLKKLSISNNYLRQLPDLSQLRDIVEIRAGQNRIMRIPPWIATLGHLRLLNLSSNLLHDAKDVKLLKDLIALKSVDLRHNTSLKDYIPLIKENKTVCIADAKRVQRKKVHGITKKFYTPPLSDPQNANQTLSIPPSSHYASGEASSPLEEGTPSVPKKLRATLQQPSTPKCVSIFDAPSTSPPQDNATSTAPKCTSIFDVPPKANSSSAQNSTATQNVTPQNATSVTKSIAKESPPKGKTASVLTLRAEPNSTAPKSTHKSPPIKDKSLPREGTSKHPASEESTTTSTTAKSKPNTKTAPRNEPAHDQTTTPATATTPEDAEARKRKRKAQKAASKEKVSFLEHGQSFFTGETTW
ncbi:hypothetical protein Pelo_4577 [Pelomyxa schiedti]|nr:hypothetical protein Pelo_4577 [Pelomyxa schiedti]